MRSGNALAAFANYRTKTTSKTAAGREIEMDKTVNAPYDEVRVFGKSEQKADWSQAEGVTSQAVTQQGENLLDLERLEGNFNVSTTSKAELTYLDNGYRLKAISGTANQWAWQNSTNPIRLEPNTDYTFAIDFSVLQGTFKEISIGFAYNYAGSGSVSFFNRIYINSAYWNEETTVYLKTFNSEETDTVYFAILANADTTTGEFEAEITNIQLLKGTYTEETLPDYEPFVPDSPSPEYPSEMTSIIPAGSYQIPTENGIYEVTLEEPLRGLGEYRDKLCFDSVSGKGYLERAIGVKTDLRVTALYHNINRNEKCAVFHSGNTTGRMPGNMPYLCSHFEQNDKIFNDTNYIEGIWLHTSSLYPNAVYVKLRKERLDLTDNTTVINSANTFLATLPTELLYVLEVPVRSSLTLTKVESSAAPVLPWRAYGENLFDLESLYGTMNVYRSELTYLENGYIFKAVSGTGNQYAWQKDVNPIRLDLNTDYTLSFDFEILQGTSEYIGVGIAKNYSGSGSIDYLARIYCSSNKTYYFNFNSGEYKRVYLYFIVNADTTTVEFEEKITNIQLLKGSYTEETLPDYESFDSTPPESLAVSPDYPSQIYSLTDVTVTSRGRNLFNAEDWYTFLRSYTTTFVSKVTLDGYECIKYQPNGTYDKPYMQGRFKPNTQYTIKYKGRQDAVHEDTSSGFWIFYTDGSSTLSFVENTTEWKEYVVTTVADKTVDYLAMTYNYGYPIYIVESSIQLVEGAYTAETIPVCDRYRCTSVEIPLTLSSVPQGDGEISDVVQSDTSVKHTRNISEKVFTGAEEVVWTSAVDTATGKIDFSVLASGIMTGQEFQLVCSHFEYAESQNVKIPCIYRFQNNQYLYFRMLASDLEITEADDDTAKKTKIKAWFAKQNELGMPVTVLYALQTPTQTDYTSQDWGEDMLSLRTAPYYTELFADKETGGLQAVYKTIKSEFNGIPLYTSEDEQAVVSGGEDLYARKY